MYSLNPSVKNRGGTVWREHLAYLMHNALGHGPRAQTDIDRQQELALRVDCCPHPLRRARQTLDCRLFAHLPVLDGTEHGIQLIEWDLLDVHLAQKVARKSP